VKRLLVADTGSRDTRLYFVNVSGFRVAESELWDRIYAPAAAADTPTNIMPSQRRGLEPGEDLGDGVGIGLGFEAEGGGEGEAAIEA
jgi:hypothetical protein